MSRFDAETARERTAQARLRGRSPDCAHEDCPGCWPEDDDALPCWPCFRDRPTLPAT